MNKKIVMISDIHNAIHGIKDLPDGDILLFAGDLTSVAPIDYDGQIRQTRNVLKNLLKQKNKWEEIYGVFGNHDTLFDERHFANEILDRVIEYDDSGFIYKELKDKVYDNLKELNFIDKESSNVKPFRMVTTKDGIRILLSSLSNKITDIPNFNDPWAFHFTKKDKIEIRQLIEQHNGVDIIVSHSPPHTLRDKTYDGRSVGSKFMLELIDDYSPKLFVTGHIHESQGLTFYKETYIANASIVTKKYSNYNEPIVIELDF